MNKLNLPTLPEIFINKRIILILKRDLNYDTLLVLFQKKNLLHEMRSCSGNGHSVLILYQVVKMNNALFP